MSNWTVINEKGKKGIGTQYLPYIIQAKKELPKDANFDLVWKRAKEIEQKTVKS